MVKFVFAMTITTLGLGALCIIGAIFLDKQYGEGQYWKLFYAGVAFVILGFVLAWRSGSSDK